jgi:hypothetical protein
MASFQKNRGNLVEGMKKYRSLMDSFLYTRDLIKHPVSLNDLKELLNCLSPADLVSFVISADDIAQQYANIKSTEEVTFI